jgi:signal peptidase I/DNA-binding XRE family transcriptional regulator
MSFEDEFRRFKQVREELKLTQAAFAEELGIGATTADIERGRTRIPGHAVKELLKKYGINPLWLFGESGQKYRQSEQVMLSPRVITVDGAGKDNIVMVSAKAAAGYPLNIADTQWFESLPAFGIPLPEFRNATFRGFQVDGDSMMPMLRSGEWLFTKAVADWNNLNSNTMYVVITAESILVKKIKKESHGTSIDLVSLNPEYQPIRIDRSEVRELWEVGSKLSFNISSDPTSIGLHQLHQEIGALREEVRRMGR